MKKSMFLSFSLVVFSASIIKGAEDPIIHRGNSPANYRTLLDQAVINGNIDTIIQILTSENPDYPDLINLKYKYPLAMKLYRILMDEATGEDFTEEAKYIPFEKIIYTVKQLAIEGGNDRFLKNMP